MKTPFPLILLLLAFDPPVGAQDEPAANPAARHEQQLLVGKLGRTRALEFVGNQSFPTDILRKSLAKDLSFVLASHSSERLDAFLSIVAERLHLGYLHCGFPAAKVRVSHQAGKGEGTLLVTIEEGPRYRQGDIQVTGGEGIDHRQFVEALKSTPEDRGKSSLIGSIRAALAPHAALLPPPLAPDPAATEETSVALNFSSLADSSSDEADWQPGEPVEFEKADKQPLEDRVRYHLAAQGRPLARFTTAHVLQPGGTADLRIDIADAGPEAQVGTVKVSGARSNTDAEIRRAAGLEEGHVILPRQLDEAMLGLWRSGRFLPFEIDMHPRGGKSRVIDFHIRVCELEKVPPLATPATPDQQCAMKFIDWINRGMDGDELLVERTDAGAGTMSAGWSHRDGMFFRYLTDDSQRGISLAQTAKGLSLVVRDHGEVLPARLDLALGGFRGWCYILAQNGPQPMSISFGVGFSTLGAKSDSFQSLNLLITPAYVFLKEDEITRDGDTVVIRDLFQLDAATGRLTGIRGGSVRTTPGGVRERQVALDREIQAVKSGTSAVAWIDAFSALAGVEEIAEGIPDRVHRSLADAREIARMIDLVGGSGVIAPILKLFDGKAENEDKADEFFIPNDPATLQQGGMLALLVGAGSIAFAEDLLPDIEWASTFTRELLFIAGGRTGHTRQVMNDLLRDPSIGPYSCLVCARLLETFDPATARRFLAKAGDQATAEAFRHDWRMFLGTRTVLGESLDRTVASLKAFGPDQEAETAGLLGPGLGTWLRGFFESLRQHPADQPLAEWIAPAMDRLWNDHLAASLRRSLEGKIPPADDPREVAATVDGVPVSRALVRILKEQNRAALRNLPLPAVHDARPWTRDPALATAIRATLMVEELRRSGRCPPDEKIQASLDALFPALAGLDEADWIRETGMSRPQLRHWALALAAGNSLLQQFRAEAGEPEKQELLDHFKAHPQVFRNRVAADVVIIKHANPSPKELIRCHRLIAGVVSLTEKGLPMAVTKQVTEEDPESACGIFSQVFVTPDSLQFPILWTIEDLEEGEVSESVELRTGIAVVMLRARKEDPAIDFGRVEKVVTEHWKKRQIDNIANRWFTAREVAAVIRVLGPVDAPAISSAFGELLAGRPDSRLGLVGDFWLKMGAGDQAATDAAFERLLGAEWKNPGLPVFLVEPLANKNRRDLALRCLEKAHTAQPAVARSYMDALVDQHAGHGCELGKWVKDQRDQLPKVEDENR